MKTIKEMATETFPDAVNYNSHCSNLDKRYGYIVGAKVALNEIEKIIELQPNEPICRFIAENIKKMKG